MANQEKKILVHHFLEESARRCPDKVALIHGDIRATYRELNNRANQFCHWLIDQGVPGGERVVLLLENSLEYVVSYYGALKAGTIVAPLSKDIKSDGLRLLLAELEPRVLVSSARFERMLLSADLPLFKIDALVLNGPKLDWSSAPFSVHSWDDVGQTRDSEIRQVSISDSELASIIYTSGSTGRPKGAMLTHRNVVSNTWAICESLRLTESDVQMVVLPFFYVMGKSLLNTHMAVGGTVVLNNKFAYPATVLKEMVEEHVTGFSGVPSTYAYLLHRSPLAKYRDKLESLRYCSQAGGHMSRWIKRELREVLPDHCEIFVMYGTTEASARLTCLEPGCFKDKMDSVGKPISGVTLRILNEDGRKVQRGQTGQLVASGPNIMQGYWKDPAATSEVLDQDGYNTGDLAYQDDEGFYYVVGRKDDLIKVGGHRINPQEIEDVLMGTGLLLETAVFGIPDRLLENRLLALSCPKNGDCQEADIMRICAEKLPRYKLPGEIKLVRALPKNSSGKIDRKGCLELIGQEAKQLGG